jgi:hypothetical protein
MKRRRELTAKELSELGTLRERMLLTIKFVAEVEDSDNTRDARVDQILSAAVEKAVADDDLITLRVLSREIDGMALALAPHQREGLEAILAKRLGINVEEEQTKLRRRAATAIRRGTVGSERERQHLQRYLEMLEQIGGDPAEIEAVHNLLRG